MQLGFSINAGIIGMGGGSILQYSHNLSFGQNFMVVQRQKQRFADRKSGSSGNVGDVGHSQTFHESIRTPGKMPFTVGPCALWQICARTD